MRGTKAQIEAKMARRQPIVALLHQSITVAAEAAEATLQRELALARMEGLVRAGEFDLAVRHHQRAIQEVEVALRARLITMADAILDGKDLAA